MNPVAYAIEEAQNIVFFVQNLIQVEVISSSFIVYALTKKASVDEKMVAALEEDKVNFIGVKRGNAENEKLQPASYNAFFTVLAIKPCLSRFSATRMVISNKVDFVLRAALVTTVVIGGTVVSFNRQVRVVVESGVLMVSVYPLIKELLVGAKDHKGVSFGNAQIEDYRKPITLVTSIGKVKLLEIYKICKRLVHRAVDRVINLAGDFTTHSKRSGTSCSIISVAVVFNRVNV